MRILLPLIAVVVLGAGAFFGVQAAGLQHLFGVVIPYAALAIFLLGMIYRILKWAASPVPFRIPTTCGQEKSLPWIKTNPLESPNGMVGVIGRMALEVLFFRSLFRNLKFRYEAGEGSNPSLTYRRTLWLWLFGLTFHWSFLFVFVRHLRLFTQPVPAFVLTMNRWDAILPSLLQHFNVPPLHIVNIVGAPPLLISDIVLVTAVTLLFLRRVWIPQVRYISLPADYFPLFLILSIALSGICMRYFFKVDMIHIKELTMGLATFHPIVPAGIGAIFFVHLFLVCTLFAYFPFSKLVHMAGVFLSPTRNLANNSRAKRHVNPWNYPVKVHTYDEYEDEFREVMKNAGIPVEKD